MTHTILITGATDGIGRELARIYQRRGARLVLVGRKPQSELDPTLFTDTNYCRVDLAQPDSASRIETALRQWGLDRIDLLIHNAGIGYYGPIEQQPPDGLRTLIDTNLRAPIALTRVLLPRVERAGGALVFISTVATALPAPEYATYTASKAALDGFARSLRIELRNRVRVQVIHPGATRTGMHARSGAPLDRLGWARFPPPEQVAARIVQAIDGGGTAATIGAANRVLRLAGYYAPGLMHWLLRRRGTR